MTGFEIGTIRATQTSGASAKEMSPPPRDSSPGNHVNTLHGWGQQFASDPKSAFPGNGETAGRDEQIRQQEEALKRAEQEEGQHRDRRPGDRSHEGLSAREDRISADWRSTPPREFIEVGFVGRARSAYARKVRHQTATPFDRPYRETP